MRNMKTTLTLGIMALGFSASVAMALAVSLPH